MSDDTLNHARALHAAGKFREVEALVRNQLHSAPKNVDYLNLLAFSLQNQDRIEEAITAFSATLAVDPSNFEALYSKAVLLMQTGLLKEALWYFEKAIKRDPKFVQSYNSVGLILQTLGEVEAAKSCFETALKLEPSHPLRQLRYDSIGEIFFSNDAAIEKWRSELMDTLQKYKPLNLRDYIEEISSSYAMPFYYLPYQGKDNRAIYEAYAHIFSGTAEKPPANTSANRVGFVVTASTPMVFLTIMGGILNHWDSAKAEAILFCYPHSIAKIKEYITNPQIKIVAIPSHFGRAVQTIQSVGCGLIYYWEIGSDSTNYFMPYFRLAPIQCTSWGTFHTTGIPHMDYFISSVHQEPEGAEAHYTEKLVKLPSLPAYFMRLKPTTKAFTRADFGFTEHEHIYLCPQHLCKIQPDFDAMLLAVLQADHKAIIVLMESGKFPDWGEKLRLRMQKTIAGYTDRVRFLGSLSHQKYLEFIQIADVLLDTTNFGGGMTTLESFSFGLPIVTLPGKFMRGRFTSACYRVMEIEDCIAKDPSDYVNIAVKIATDADYRSELREKILSRCDRLYENKNAVTEFQDFCLKALSLNT